MERKSHYSWSIYWQNRIATRSEGISGSYWLWLCSNGCSTKILSAAIEVKSILVRAFPRTRWCFTEYLCSISITPKTITSHKGIMWIYWAGNSSLKRQGGVTGTLLLKILIQRNEIFGEKFSLLNNFFKFFSNLANHPWFIKLKTSKLVLTYNNLLTNLLICQTFFVKCLKSVNLPNFSPPKFPSIQYTNVPLLTWLMHFCHNLRFLRLED